MTEKPQSCYGGWFIIQYLTCTSPLLEVDSVLQKHITMMVGAVTQTDFQVSWPPDKCKVILTVYV